MLESICCKFAVIVTKVMCLKHGPRQPADCGCYSFDEKRELHVIKDPSKTLVLGFVSTAKPWTYAEAISAHANDCEKAVLLNLRT